MRINLTREIAHAAGWDEGNRSMRAAGRAHWNAEDSDAAARETNRLYDLLPDGGVLDCTQQGSVKKS